MYLHDIISIREYKTCVKDIPHQNRSTPFIYLQLCNNNNNMKLPIAISTIIFLMISAAYTCTAQNYPKIYVESEYLNDIEGLKYIQVLGERAGFAGLGKKVKVSIDIGQKNASWSKATLKDENGDKLKFNSVIDALNALYSQGWELKDSYVLTVSNQNIYHHIFEKIEP